MIYTIESIYGSPDNLTVSTQANLPNKNGIYKRMWVRAVPKPWYPGLFESIADAWTVFRGKAIALKYPEAGELENALKMALVEPRQLRD